MSDSYFIRDGFRPRPPHSTAPEFASDYWNPRRIRMARSYQRPVYDYARSLLRRHDFRTVIDVGCGPATKLVEILRPVATEIVGLDAPPAIGYCRRMFGAVGEFHVVNLEHPTFTVGRRFDLVICSDVIEHLNNPDSLLQFLPLLVTQHGLIVLSTPERDALRGAHVDAPANPEHVREWNRAELAAYLMARGFDLLEHRLLPPMGIVRPALLRVLRTTLDQLAHGRSVRTCQLVVCRPRSLG